MKRIILDTRRKTILIADRVDDEGENLAVYQGSVKRLISHDKIAYIEEITIPQKASEPIERPPTPTGLSSERPLPLPKAFREAVENNLSDLPPEPNHSRPAQSSPLVLFPVHFSGSLDGVHEVLISQDSVSASSMSEELTRAVFADFNVKNKIYGHQITGLEKHADKILITAKEKTPISSTPESYQAAVQQIASLPNRISPMLGGLTPTTKGE